MPLSQVMAYPCRPMLLGTLTPDKKDTMAALLSQGFQEIAVLSESGKLQEAKSLTAALAPILACVKDPSFDLTSTATALERHHRGYPPRKGRTNWHKIWALFVSDLHQMHVSMTTRFVSPC
jgi:hypothetical protein